MKVLYDTILKATYIGRPNRFVVTLDLNGESVLAHLPNPGRTTSRMQRRNIAW